MGRLKEINVKAQFAFSPNSTYIATGTAAGSLSDDLSDEAKIEIYDTQLNNNDSEFSLKAAGAVVVSDRCTSIAWGGVTADRKHGVVVAAMENGAIDLWDPTAILDGADRDTALLCHSEAHTGSVRCIDFSSVQTNLLASAGTKGEFFVWDTSKPTTSPTAYKSTRLDEIISIAWNKKVGHIIALGGRSGALSVWDLRKKSELIHIPTRYGISAIAWHPTEPTILSTSSVDDHNPVIQVWDLRNANAPKTSLSGHEKGVLSLAWCPHDAELLLSSGSDNRTLIWNPLKSMMVAELPASSQWVHKVSWCARQPQIIANATLDGKISIYSLQDTIAPEAPVVVDDTPAGDDFFDSIPKNFQAQTASFTLKQTPKWLKRPVGGRFAFGSRLVQFNSKSTQVELVKHHFSTTATTIAKEIQETLDSQTLPELCEASRQKVQNSEQQDWHIIETLASEHARGALLKYLGFDKEEPVTEVMKQSEEDPSSDPSAQIKDNLPNGGETSETSVFGAETADDDFLGIINSAAPAEISSTGEKPTSDVSNGSSKPFSIFDDKATAGDNLVTKAILTGQFNRAIDVCLSEDRLSDAFMLALCGGLDSQKRVQKAYFEKTSIPYGRLLSSIIAGDLRDVVSNADLKNWKETLAILCNYAKPEDFSLLCELLGQRLERENQDPIDATLCYLAGSKLEHLVRLWSTAQEQDEQASLSKGSLASPSEIHATSLGALIRKIAIFRKAVAFSDPQTKVNEKHTLAMLYDKYLEFAQLISDEGDSKLALQYVGMVPSDFDGASTMKERLVSPSKPVQAAQSQKSSVTRPTGMRNVYSQAQLSQEPVQPASPARATSMYAPPVTTQPAPASTSTNGVTTSSQAPVHNPYAPPANQFQPKQPMSPYGQPQSTYQSPYGMNSTNSVQQSQQPQYNSFVPPPRVNSSGPPILPAAQRKDITPWNDAPDIPLPVQRRATPAVNRSAITSPFQAATAPTLQGFGPNPPQPLAPPPKTRSPAPPRPAVVNTIQNTHEQQRRPSNPYAPNPSSEVSAPSPSAPISSSYAPSAGPLPQGPSLARYGVPVGQPQQSNQAFPLPPPQQSGPPPAAQSALFAPPPKLSNGPARATGPRAGASPKIVAPPVGRGVNLSPEPSRQSSPVQEKFELPPAKYPSGDRTHIPESDRPIEAELLALLSRLQTVSPEKYRRPLEDTGRRLSLLFDQLNNTQLTDGTREQLRMLASCLRNAEWGRGYAIHMELTSDKMHECRDWIVGIKTLIVLGKKSVEEVWS